jgi:hypothetical protein
MVSYWITVASRKHVLEGVSGGFCQVCHGKAGPLRRMVAGDWIAYYSPTMHFGEKETCRKFTAIGQVLNEDPYPFTMWEGFTPWRRNISFHSCTETAIEPLIDELSFISDKSRWGFPFRRGCFAVAASDFQIIARAMGVFL